jgi:hypothetical protein
MKNERPANKNLIIIFCFFFMIVILFTIVTLIPKDTIVIFLKIVTLIPKDTIGNDIPGENFAHIYAFLILSCILCFSKVAHVKYIYLILFFYGFLIEILQLIVGRDFSYLDMLHNFIGISLGIGSYLFVKKIIVLKKNSNFLK